MSENPAQPSRSRPARLALLTLLAVCGSIGLVGLLVVPLVIRHLEQEYLELQADTNARQARALAKFAELRLEEGFSVEEVQSELQKLLEGADADRGYSCVVNQEDALFVCHPMAMAVGMEVAGKEASFSEEASTRPSFLEPWERVIVRGVTGPGALFYPNGQSEIIHMEAIDGTEWTVTTHENTARVQEELAKLRGLWIGGSFVVGLLLAIPSSLAARLVSRRHEQRIEEEQDRSERLLLNILPPAIAERLKSEEKVIADRHPEVTVLFADIVGFTPMAADTTAADLVTWLNRIISRFDEICEAHQLEKIKTIGDAYMLCGGLEGDPKDAAVRVVEAGLEMIRALEEFPRSVSQPPLSLRVGVHTGELVAGVIGKRKFSYDVWGDVVNTASRLEAAGVPGAVQVSEATSEIVRDRFEIESRGEIAIKGKGELPVWLVCPS